MPQTPEHEERHIGEYVESQLRDDEDAVTLVQGVGQERIAGTTFKMYDVHTVKGRWWVISEPTNLYDQAEWPSVDYTLSFHLGLGLRIHERSRIEADDEERTFAEGAWRRYSQAVDAMNAANDAEDFQAIGVRCREALLAVARENRAAIWLGNVAEAPKGDDLKGWMTIFAGVLLPEQRQCAYLRDVTARCWDLAVELQHNANATPWDAELTLNAVHNVLECFMLARLKHSRGAPDRCPRCRSYRLASDGEVAEVDHQQGYCSWKVCGACEWRSDSSFSAWPRWDAPGSEDSGQ